MFFYNLIAYSFMVRRKIAYIGRVFTSEQLKLLRSVYKSIEAMYPSEAEFFQYIYTQLGVEISFSRNPFCDDRWTPEGAMYSTKELLEISNISEESIGIDEDIGSQVDDPFDEDFTSVEDNPANDSAIHSEAEDEPDLVDNSIEHFYSAPTTPEGTPQAESPMRAMSPLVLSPIPCVSMALISQADLTLDSNHSTVSRIEGHGGAKCAVCQKLVRGQKRLRRHHIANHHLHANCKCPVEKCGANFRTVEYLQAHIKRRHNFSTLTLQESSKFKIINDRFTCYMDQHMDRFFPHSSRINQPAAL
ncbi:hypothetical protein L596_028493 [Steinernema carpocapsae]|uniref:C2H2-type domain-containing protein n=1 Tax=Steinernema carpocapsae TaxID=34508 RepID=A0A4V5ZXW8_STECR|nr:hypothetical protein L596_028493 [Steinernema carpocapsae]